MINRNVVLILGAGASMPFGFPSGFELMTLIINDLNPSNSNPMLSLISHIGFKRQEVEDFRNALRQSGKKSVDAFLEHRTEFIPIGKVATACVLLPHESEERIFGRNASNWYEYFFNKLNAKFEEFDKNSVAIITFNYDRSLEYYLLTALRHSYGKSSEECSHRLGSIPIVHLYGQLGDLPLLGNDGIEFGSRLNTDVVRKAAAGIQIIHEDVAKNPQFQRAHRLLNKAERVCFLGFGYDQTNLERLAGYTPPPKQGVIGSAKGLTNRECSIIRQTLTKLGFPVPDRDTLEPLDLGSSKGGLDNVFGEANEFLRHHCALD